MTPDRDALALFPDPLHRQLLAAGPLTFVEMVVCVAYADDDLTHEQRRRDLRLAAAAGLLAQGQLSSMGAVGVELASVTYVAGAAELAVLELPHDCERCREAREAQVTALGARLGERDGAFALHFGAARLDDLGRLAAGPQAQAGTGGYL